MALLGKSVFLVFLFAVALAEFGMQVEEILRGVNVDSGPANGGCRCAGKSCGCCQQIRIKQIKFNKNVCVNINYAPDSFSVTLKLTVDGKTIYSKTFSAKNPPGMCVKVAKLGKLCLTFYKLDYKNRALSGCIRVEAKVMKKTVAKVDLGCFNIPAVGDATRQDANSTRLLF